MTRGWNKFYQYPVSENAFCTMRPMTPFMTVYIDAFGVLSFGHGFTTEFTVVYNSKPKIMKCSVLSVNEIMKKVLNEKPCLLATAVSVRRPEVFVMRYVLRIVGIHRHKAGAKKNIVSPGWLW